MAFPSTDDSFGGIHFRVLVQGSGQQRAGTVSNRPVPWDNENIVQLGGRRVKQADLRVYLADGDAYNALLQAVSSQDTLTYHEFSGTATLVSVGKTEKWLPGDRRILPLQLLLDSD